MTTNATLKAKILEELDYLSAETLAEVLTYVQGLNPGSNIASQDEVWQAYLESEKEREEVYHRLANS